MNDLAGFLLARIAEDEAVAREATPGPWKPEGNHVGEPMNETWEVAGPMGEDGWTADVVTVDFDRDYHMPMGGCPRREDASHIARHDPARVLAECEAKRRLVDIAFAHEATIDGEWGCCHDGEQIAAGECPSTPPDQIEMLRLLALPYADHADYREAWRP